MFKNEKTYLHFGVKVDGSIPGSDELEPICKKVENFMAIHPHGVLFTEDRKGRSFHDCVTDLDKFTGENVCENCLKELK